MSSITARCVRALKAFTAIRTITAQYHHRFRQTELKPATQFSVDQTLNVNNEMVYLLAFAKKAITAIHLLDADRNVSSTQIVRWINLVQI